MISPSLSLSEITIRAMTTNKQATNNSLSTHTNTMIKHINTN